MPKQDSIEAVLLPAIIYSRSHHYRCAMMRMQDATSGVLWALPRACWIALSVLMLVWIVHAQHGFAFTKTIMGSQGLLNYHHVFMTVAWCALAPLDALLCV